MTDSPRIGLRLLSTNDAEELLCLVDGSRDFLRGYLPWVDDFRTIEKSRSWIKSYALQHAMDNGGDWGIRRLSDDALLGCVCLQWVQTGNRSGSLEYFLGKPYAGMGYGVTHSRIRLAVEIFQRTGTVAGLNPLKTDAAEERIVRKPADSPVAAVIHRMLQGVGLYPGTSF